MDMIKSSITFRGTSQECVAILDKVGGLNAWGDDCAFTFNAIIPMPPEIDRSSSDHTCEKGWYGWCVRHWNTRTDAVDVGIRRTVFNGSLVEIKISFENAWSPIYPIVSELSRNVPLTIEYAYEGLNTGFVIDTYYQGCRLSSERDYTDITLETVRTMFSNSFNYSVERLDFQRWAYAVLKREVLRLHELELMCREQEDDLEGLMIHYLKRDNKAPSFKDIAAEIKKGVRRYGTKEELIDVLRYQHREF